MHPFEQLNNSLKSTIKDIADTMTPQQLMCNPKLLDVINQLKIEWR